MIEAYTGLPGMGKTYAMTKRALDEIARAAWRKKKGKSYKRVFANYKIEGAEYFKELYELQNEKNIIVLVDEAGIYLPSQSWKDIPFDFIRQMRQSRHDGIDLWWSAQDFKDAATFLRRITQFENKCSRLGSFFWVKTVSPSNSKSKYGGTFYLKSSDVFSKYDTTENIDFAEYLKVGAKA